MLWSNYSSQAATMCAHAQGADISAKIITLMPLTFKFTLFIDNRYNNSIDSTNNYGGYFVVIIY